MSAADKIAEARALIADAQEIAAERREKAGESRMIAALQRDVGKDGSGWTMAAEYAERTAKVLDAFPALADGWEAEKARADALAQENAKLRSALERVATAKLQWGESLHDQINRLVKDARAALGDTP